jgi:hypothetical protein
LYYRIIDRLRVENKFDNQLMRSALSHLFSTPIRRIVFAVVIFSVIGCVKAPILFRDPRFWAEEGASFYEKFLSLSIFQAITHVDQGNYQLCTNLTIYISTLLDPLRAPFVTTFVSFSLQLIIVAQLIIYTEAHGIKFYVALLLVVAWIFLPANYETWLTATNLQWLFGVSTLLILTMPEACIRRHLRLSLVWLLLCGLSGIPAVLIGPIALARGIVDKSKSIVFLAVVLSACACAQLFFIMRFGTNPARTFIVDPLVNFVPIFFQTVLAPLIGVDSVNAISKSAPIALVSAAAAGFCFGAVIVAAAWQGAPRAAAYVASAWLFVTLIQGFSGIKPEMLISGSDGSRYFLFGSVALCLSLALATRAPQLFTRSIGTGGLALVVFVNVIGWKNSTWFSDYVQGPSWRKQVAACPIHSSCTVEIWPRPWKVTLPNHDN